MKERHELAITSLFSCSCIERALSFFTLSSSHVQQVQQKPLNVNEDLSLLCTITSCKSESIPKSDGPLRPSVLSCELPSVLFQDNVVPCDCKDSYTLVHNYYMSVRFLKVQAMCWFITARKDGQPHSYDFSTFFVSF